MSAADDEKSLNSGLFPAYPTEIVNDKNSSLFPAYSASKDTRTVDDRAEKGQPHKPLDWLENKSFGKDTAQILNLVQIKEDVSQNNTSESEKSNAEDEEDIEKLVKKRKRDGDEKEKEKKHKKKKKKHKRKHKRQLEEEEDSDQIKDASKDSFFKVNSGKIFLEDVPGLSASNAFRVDRSADKNNWTYGSLYKLHVGKYRRIAVSCLGTGDNFFANSRKSNKKNDSPEIRYYNKENRRVVKRSGELCEKKISEDPTNMDFMGFEISENKDFYKVVDITENANPLGIYDKATSSYIQGKATSSVEENVSIPSRTEDETKVTRYNQQLRDNPNNVKLWLEFVKYQDFNPHLSSTTEESQVEHIHSTSTKVIEKKLSILEKAIQLNPASIDLKITQLQLSQEVLDSSEILKQWKQLLFVHPGKLTLWQHYILYVQSNLNQFTVNKTINVYQDCLGNLRRAMSKNVHLIDEDKPTEEDFLIMMYHYLVFLHQTGYTEKAVASFQTLVELNIFRPGFMKYSDSEEDQVMFEQYWSNGVPRFGEVSAINWVEWTKVKDHLPYQYEEMGKSPPDVDEADAVEDRLLNVEQPLWKTWLQVENYRESLHWLPWRQDMNFVEMVEECEDPFRVVLFDDVQPCLFTFQNKNLHFDLIILFLHFLDVDVHKHYNSKLLEQLKTSQLFLQTVKDIQPMNWDLGFWKDNSKSSECHTSLVRQILKQTEGYFPCEKQTILKMIALDFEISLTQRNSDSQTQKTSSKELRKISKALLKEEQNRNNLLLWNWYALLEQNLGKREECLKVLVTALSMQQGLNLLEETVSLCDTVVGYVTLYFTYVRCLLGIREGPIQFTLGHREPTITKDTVQIVLNVLQCFIEGRTFNQSNSTSSASSTSVLKIKRKFRDLERNLRCKVVNSEQNFAEELLKMSIFLTSIHDYLTSGFSSMVEHYKTFLSESDEIFRDSENKETWVRVKRHIYRQWIEMAIFNQTVSISPLSNLQSVMDSALTDFPEDSEFLMLFGEIETQSFITGRLRKHFDKSIKSSQTPFPSIFCCLSEVRRHLRLIQANKESGVSVSSGETGFVHRLRSVLERSLLNPHSQHCVLLWSLYLQFEMKYGSQSRAKGLFYRAVQRCPWSKSLYKEGVALFPDQLQELVDLMTEKEIRVQIPIDEIHILKEDQ